jgi:hydroxyacylglutathione hydrolase
LRQSVAAVTTGSAFPKMLTLRALPAFQDNYIWTLSDAQGRALVVDPGEAGPVLAAARDGIGHARIQPVAILLTHHHPDHIGGTPELLRHFDVPVYGPHDARIDFELQRVGAGDTVRIPELDLQFDVIELPGHTLTHIAFHENGRANRGENGHLFCGDTLFSLGCGRLFEGTPGQMLGSLDRLAALPGNTRVCCGHEYTLANGAFASTVDPENPALRDRLGDVRAAREDGRPSLPSTISSERACNPFLRVDAPAVVAAIERHQGARVADRVQAFAALRRWKDGFRA